MLQGFHPTVASWFEARFGTPTEPQAAGWPHIQAGEDTLIAAPTGSGKTLAAFLACLDEMIRQGEALPGTTQVVYVSPLKALANDVRKNLLEPLTELRALGVPDIRTAVRTGDTTQADRQRMVRSPPHVLVTTPESLYVLLTSESGRKLLSTVKTAIVDEIHAVARDKRGAHLALSLERLEALCKVRPVRIGLSATQRPIEEIARFLVGASRVSAEGVPDCTIVDEGHRRRKIVHPEVEVNPRLGDLLLGDRLQVDDRSASSSRAELEPALETLRSRWQPEQLAPERRRARGVTAVDRYLRPGHTWSCHRAHPSPPVHRYPCWSMADGPAPRRRMLGSVQLYRKVMARPPPGNGPPSRSPTREPPRAS